MDAYRTERKYIHPIIAAHRLEHKISSMLRADSNNIPGGYLIRSLYFDTPDDDDYFDKINGLEQRRKIRLRIYPPNMNFVRLEQKEKHNTVQRKRSLVISRDDAIKIINGEHAVLCKYSNELADNLFLIMSQGVYRPKCMVQYYRSAYTATGNNTRISFDRQLSAGEADFGLFDSSPRLYPCFPADQIILEVKYSNFLLEHIRELLATDNNLETSASKYCMARYVG